MFLNIKLLPHNITPKAALGYDSDVRILDKKYTRKLEAAKVRVLRPLFRPNQNGQTKRQKRQYTITSNKHRLRHLPVPTEVEETCGKDERKLSPTADVITWGDQNKDGKTKSIFRVKRDGSL